MYYECSDYIPEPKLCPDGLLFVDGNPNQVWYTLFPVRMCQIIFVYFFKTTYIIHSEKIIFYFLSSLFHSFSNISSYISWFQEKCDYPFNVNCGSREFVRKYFWELCQTIYFRIFFDHLSPLRYVLWNTCTLNIFSVQQFSCAENLLNPSIQCYCWLSDYLIKLHYLTLWQSKSSKSFQHHKWTIFFRGAWSRNRS